MEHELIVFVAFGTIQVLFHNMHRISNLSLCKHFAKYHWVVWLVNPTLLESAHEYVVHIIIYSGYILHH